MTAASDSFSPILLNLRFDASIPHIIMAGGAILLMLLTVFGRKTGSTLAIRNCALIILAAAAAVTVTMIGKETIIAYNGMMSADLFSAVFILLFISLGAAIVLTADTYFISQDLQIPEFYAMLFFALTGMMFMVSARDLLIFFLGLEILSVALYVLAGLDVYSSQSSEAGLKYFLMGAFSSGFLLFGIALIYGTVGTTRLPEIGEYISKHAMSENLFMPAGLFLLLVGIGFKISMVPFHMWTPDVYQGSPLIVTGFMATGPKIAALAFGFKLIIMLFTGSQNIETIRTVISIFAAITMLSGNLLALNQNNIKRLLAASSITHVGYMLIAAATVSEHGSSAAIFYFVTYVMMNIGLVILLSLVATKQDGNITLEGIAGLAKKSPVTGLLLLIFTFSLAGIPPLGGFTAKFQIFAAAVEGKKCTLLLFSGL